jgi:hypothetical protein
MTLPITFSWRFLLIILAPERMKRFSWGEVPNPATVGLGVKKCSHHKWYRRNMLRE